MELMSGMKILFLMYNKTNNTNNLKFKQLIGVMEENIQENGLFYFNLLLIIKFKCGKFCKYFQVCK